MHYSNSSNLKKYVKAFIEFENYIKDLNSTHDDKFEKHHGYLINLKKIEEIKHKINYEQNKSKYIDFNFSPSDGVQKKDYTIEEIEFRDSNYLLNMLFNGNKYILINEDLWKLLCKEGKENTPPIIYEINYSKIKFKLSEDQTILIFSNYLNNNNLIEKKFFYQQYNDQYNNYEYNYIDVTDNIYPIIEGYYKYEKEFQENLKSWIKGRMNFGYLVDLDWFEQWEKFYDYLNIKSNYLDQYKDKKEIIDHIIFVQALNIKKQISLGEPKINKFHNKNQLDSYLKRNKLVLINTSLITSSVDLKNFIINYQLYDNKVEFFFEKQEPLIIETKGIIISYDNSNNNNIKVIDNQYNINEIISTLIMLNKFEQNMKKKLDESKSQINGSKSNNISAPFQTIFLKLVNETLINEIKNIFDYQKLKIIIDKYKINYNQEINNEQLNRILQIEEDYNKYLYSKKNEFIELKKKAFDFCKIEKISSIKDGHEFLYPMNFNALDKNLFDKFLSFLELKGFNNVKNPEEIFLTYNNGNILFRGMDDKFLGNKLSLLYIYSFFIQQDLSEVKYCPEAILSFQNYSDLINNFQKITNEKIMNEIMNPQNRLTLNYSCKICLIFNQETMPEDTPQINDNDLYDNNEEKYINKLLKFSFLFNCNYKHLYLLLKNNGQNFEERMFLINKKYIDEIKLILHFNELEDIIQKHPELKNDFNRGDSSFLYKIKSYLNRNILIEFFNTKKNDIKQKLNAQSLFNKSPKHLYNDLLNNLFYYENFQLINKDIFDSLKELDSHFDVKCIVADVIISKNKVILFLKDNEKYVINVGQMNKIDEFELEYLIQADDSFSSSFDLKKIFGAIKTTGYHNFKQKIIVNGHINAKIDHITVKAKIYRLSSESNSINNFQDNNLQNDKYISDKTKAIILLSITQNFDINKFNINIQENAEKVYLMDYNYLLNYKYLEICSLINGNNEIQKLVEKINNPQNPYISKTLEEIISKLDQEELKKIDKILQTIDLSRENWEAKAYKISLKDKSSISVYNEFILIKERIFKEISSKLSLHGASKQIEYAYKDGDIIAIHDRLKPCLFFGNINNDSHLFNLKYFLVFDYDSYLNKALQFIISYGIEQYKQEKTIFSEGSKKDLISAIYDGNYEVGSFYIYSPGINYGKINEKDYTYDMNNEKLDKVLKLYNYYSKFKLKMKANNNYDEKYFLIKKEIMNDIKKDYNYDIIIQILKKAPINNNENNPKKQKLFILKNFPEDLYDDFFNNKKQIENRMKDYTFPDSISINIPNTNQSIQIYHNFEIIEKSIASEFISGIYESSYLSYNSSPYGLWPTSSIDINNAENYMDCTLKEGKVIVYYPKTKFNNNNHVYALGSLNNDNVFIAEYLIIYKKNHEYFSTIRNKLNNYLQSIEQQLIYGPYPLTNNKVEEIGMVVGLNKISTSNIHEVNIVQNQIINPDKNDFYSKPTDNDVYNEDMVIDQDIDPEPIDDRIIKKYNLDSQTSFSKIKECFSKPPLIGLDNIGATCYMNATLQCLCNISKFVNYFKFNKNLKDLVRNDITYGNNSMLCSSFKLLIEQLWPERLYFTSNTVAGLPSYGSIGSNNTYSNKKNESFAPKEFKKKISDMDDLFKGVAANDAKDLVNFLIMTLHKELNTAEKKNLTTNAVNQDQRNQQLMFNLFTQDFVNNNKSIISDLFYGVNYNIVQCNGCMTRSFNYQTYFFFVFPLEEVRIFKSQNNYNNNFNFNMNCNNNEVNIYDCFLYDQRINYMMGENTMYCNFCKRQCNSQMCTLLAFGPEIIIIILNRGQGAQFKVKVNFTEQLNLYNFIDYKDTGVNYQLIGVITHLGGNDMSGHFIAYCKNPISNSWYQYNDSIVNEVNQANFQAEVIDYAMPYLLFYQKVGQ